MKEFNIGIRSGIVVDEMAALSSLENDAQRTTYIITALLHAEDHHPDLFKYVLKRRTDIERPDEYTLGFAAVYTVLEQNLEELNVRIPLRASDMIAQSEIDRQLRDELRSMDSTTILRSVEMDNDNLTSQLFKYINTLSFELLEALFTLLAGMPDDPALQSAIRRICEAFLPAYNKYLSFHRGEKIYKSYPSIKN